MYAWISEKWSAYTPDIYLKCKEKSTVRVNEREMWFLILFALSNGEKYEKFSHLRSSYLKVLDWL